jgi:hypothetical protein
MLVRFAAVAITRKIRKKPNARPPICLARLVASEVWIAAGTGCLLSMGFSMGLEKHSSFSIVCENCDYVAVQMDLAENAPSSTPVLCAKCKYPRGTLGALRALSEMDREAVEI